MKTIFLDKILKKSKMFFSLHLRPDCIKQQEANPVGGRKNLQLCGAQQLQQGVRQTVLEQRQQCIALAQEVVARLEGHREQVQGHQDHLGGVGAIVGVAQGDQESAVGNFLLIF